MSLQTIKLADHISLERLIDYCAARRRAAPQYQNVCNRRAAPQYQNVCNRRVYDAYAKARASHLRYNRKTNVLRDDRLGVLARPSDPSDWSEASLEDARAALMGEVWCTAVAQFNRDMAGPEAGA